MKTSKRLIALALSLVLCLSLLAGCGNKDTGGDEGKPGDTGSSDFTDQGSLVVGDQGGEDAEFQKEPVSYIHLTLPTIQSV